MPQTEGGSSPGVAFVLGGGGIMGAAEVGMLLALREAGIAPGLVLGTSVGAVNGAVLAADPDGAVDRLAQLWTGWPTTTRSVESSNGSRRWRGPALTCTENEALLRLLERNLPVRRRSGPAPGGRDRR